MDGKIEEACWVASLSPEQLDAALALGLRHFGERFYRYSETLMQGRKVHIIALRICLADFVLSRSQKRVLRKNKDTLIELLPASSDLEKQEMFTRHSERFSENRPQSLGDFISAQPAKVPCSCLNIEARLSGGNQVEQAKLLAFSYLDIGHRAASSVYAVFDPEYEHLSLGTYTLLKEIEYSAAAGKKYLYIGYSTIESSAYDYKKQFSALEYYDWQGGWQKYRQQAG